MTVLGEPVCSSRFLSPNAAMVSAAVTQHFADIGQSLEDHSVTFENGHL